MFQWVEEHPYLSGGIVLAAGVLILIVMRGKSSGGASPSGYSGPSDAVQIAQTQSAAQLQALGIQANAHAQDQQFQMAHDAQQYAAELAAQTNQLNSTGNLTSLNVNAHEADVAYALAGLRDTNSTQLAMTQAQISGSENINAAQIAGVVAVSQIAANEQGHLADVQQNIAGINAETSVANTTLAAGVATNQQNTAAATAQAQIAAALATVRSNNDASVSIEGTRDAAGVLIAQTQANAAVANTKTVAQSQVDIATIAGDVAINQSNNNTSVQNTISNNWANVADTQSNNAASANKTKAIGGWVSDLLGIFF